MVKTLGKRFCTHHQAMASEEGGRYVETNEIGPAMDLQDVSRAEAYVEVKLDGWKIAVPWRTMRHGDSFLFCPLHHPERGQAAPAAICVPLRG